VPGQHGVLDPPLDAVAPAHVDVEMDPHLVAGQPQRPRELFGELRHLHRGPHIQQAGVVAVGAFSFAFAQDGGKDSTKATGKKGKGSGKKGKDTTDSK
jgi:hypothetical protein